MKSCRPSGLVLAGWAVCVVVAGCTLAESPPATEQAARPAPDTLEDCLERGLEHAASKEWDAAIQAYRRALELQPDHVKAHHNLGNVYFRKGDFEQAVTAYGRALELQPDYVLAAFHLGWTLRQLHRADPAQQAFERCLAIETDRPRDLRTRVDCIFGLGSIRHRAGDYVASARMMEQVLAFHPSHFEARYYLGMAYRQLGRMDEAREQLSIHREMLRQRHEALEELVPPMDP